MPTPRLTPEQVAQVSVLVSQYITTQRDKYAPRAIQLPSQQLSANQIKEFGDLIANMRNLTLGTTVHKADRRHLPMDFLPDGVTAVKVKGHNAGVIGTEHLDAFKKAHPDAEVLQ